MIAQNIINDFKDIYQKRELIQYMVQSIEKSIFFKSLFGKLWFIIDGIVQILIYLFLFMVAYRSNKFGFYGVFSTLVVGVSHYMFLYKCVTSSMTVFIDKENILTQVKISPIVLYTVSFLSDAKEALYFVIIALMINFYMNGAEIFSLLSYFFNFLLLIIISWSFGLLLATLYVFYRDLRNLVQFTLRILMYLCPVVYSLDQMPFPLRRLMPVNPLAYLFDGFHKNLIYHQTMTSIGFLFLFISSLGIFFYSHRFYFSKKSLLTKYL